MNVCVKMIREVGEFQNTWDVKHHPGDSVCLWMEFRVTTKFMSVGGEICIFIVIILKGIFHVFMGQPLSPDGSPPSCMVMWNLSF